MIPIETSPPVPVNMREELLDIGIRFVEGFLWLAGQDNNFVGGETHEYGSEIIRVAVSVREFYSSGDPNIGIQAGEPVEPLGTSTPLERTYLLSPEEMAAFEKDGIHTVGDYVSAYKSPAGRQLLNRHLLGREGVSDKIAFLLADYLHEALPASYKHTPSATNPD